MRLVLRLGILATLLLAACTPAAAPQPAAPAPNTPSAPTEQRDENQVLRIGVTGLIANMSPQSSSSNVYMFWPFYDNLTQFAANYEVKPSLAEKWDVSPDGLTWTFTIRPDVTFTNGDKLTAEDVAFTVNEILKSSWPQRSFINTTTGAKAINATTVEITTKQPDMSVPNAGPYLWIVPKNYFESVGGIKGFQEKPMGSGPYELVEFRSADTIHYKKKSTPHPFRKPVANEITIRAIPETSQIVAGLRTGEIDIATQVNFNGDQIDQLKKENINITANMASVGGAPIMQGRAEVMDTPLKIQKVRLAMNYAIDKDTINKTIYNGYAQPVGQLAVPGSLYWDPDAKPIPYDPAKAKQLLAEAGYPNGFHATLDFTPGMTRPDYVLALQGYLKAVGVDLELISNELGVFVDKRYGRNNQVIGDMSVGGTSDGNGFFTQGRTFNGCGKPAGGIPESISYCNPEWDRLMDQSYGERDPKKRSEIMIKANRIFQQDVPTLFLLAQPIYVVSTQKVRGISLAMPLVYNFDSAYKVK